MFVTWPEHQPTNQPTDRPIDQLLLVMYVLSNGISYTNNNNGHHHQHDVCLQFACYIYINFTHVCFQIARVRLWFFNLLQWSNKINKKITKQKAILWYKHFQKELESADAYLVVFSVVDKASFAKAEQILVGLHDTDLLRTRPAILVANKIDLARSRAISVQGEFFFYFIWLFFFNLIWPRVIDSFLRGRNFVIELAGTFLYFTFFPILWLIQLKMQDVRRECIREHKILKKTYQDSQFSW